MVFDEVKLGGRDWQNFIITWIVDTSFDAMTQCNTKFGLFILELVVKLWCHILREE